MEPMDGARQHHAPQRALADLAMQALLPIDIGDFVGIKLPRAYQSVRENLDRGQLATAADSAREIRRPRARCFSG
jgi:hypothetical protein